MGKIWINPAVPRCCRRRLRTHEKTEIKHRREGDSYIKAHNKALVVEHKGMTQRQISKYEGHLGAVARWHPAHHRIRRY